MKKYIHVTKEVREKLMQIFGVTQVMVWKALTFESDSALANKIRKAAIECGGTLMSELPVMEALHDNDNVIRQYMPNGAMLEFDKTTGCGDVIFKGESVRRYPNVMLSDIGGIQQFAAALR